MDNKHRPLTNRELRAIADFVRRALDFSTMQNLAEANTPDFETACFKLWRVNAKEGKGRSSR